MPEDNNQYSPYTPPQTPPQPAPQQPLQPAQPFERPVVRPMESVQPFTPQPAVQYPQETEQLAAIEQEAPTGPLQQFSAPEVAAPQSIEATPVVNDYATPKVANKKKKFIVAGIIAGAILLLGGGGVYATYALWYQNPEKVLADAVTNAIKAKTVTYKGTMTADSNDVKVAIEFDGVEAGLSSRDVNAKITLTTQGKEFKLNGSALADKDGNIFFKVGNLKAVVDQTLGATGMASAFDGLIAKIDNKWIRISADDLADFSKEASDAKKCATDVLKKLDTDKATRDEIATIYGKNKFIVIDSSLPARSVAGVDSMGYKLSFNKTVAKSFVDAVNQTQLMKDLQKCDDSFKLDADAITREPSSGTTATFEVSVSRWSHEFTQLKAGATSKDGSGSATIEPLFNKDVKVVAPTDFLTLKQLQAEIESAMSAAQESALGSIQERAKTSEAQAQAYAVIKKAETFNALESKYPTLAELKAGANAEARLTPDTAALVTSSKITASTPTHLQYELCSAAAKGGHVRYFDTSAGKVVELTFGDCSSSVL